MWAEVEAQLPPRARALAHGGCEAGGCAGGGTALPDGGASMARPKAAVSPSSLLPPRSSAPPPSSLLPRQPLLPPPSSLLRFSPSPPHSTYVLARSTRPPVFGALRRGCCVRNAFVREVYAPGVFLSTASFLCVQASSPSAGLISMAIFGGGGGSHDLSFSSAVGVVEGKPSGQFKLAKSRRLHTRIPQRSRTSKKF